MSDHLIRWAVELNEFDIQYKPRPMIKSQALANFIAECTIPDEALATQQQLAGEDTPPPSRPWILHVDGLYTPSASGAWIILTSPKGEAIEYVLRFAFPASNNEVEYEALLTSLKLAMKS